jgi:hypothetical protein
MNFPDSTYAINLHSGPPAGLPSRKDPIAHHTPVAITEHACMPGNDHMGCHMHIPSQALKTPPALHRDTITSVQSD